MTLEEKEYAFMDSIDNGFALKESEMTLEEMAEKYYYKNFPVTLNFGEEERKKAVIEVFLAGAKENEEQLKLAKEHIRTLISCLIDWVQEGDKDYCYIADAEQFLRGERK